MGSGLIFRGHHAIPGVGSILETQEKTIGWAVPHEHSYPMVKDGTAVLSSTLTDSGNSPTNLLRPGLALGKISSTGELAAWNVSGTDGTEVLHGFLLQGINMNDRSGSAEDKAHGAVLLSGAVKAANLLIPGQSSYGLSGVAGEHVLRKQMRGRFILDDELENADGVGANAYGYRFIREIAKTGNYTVVAADNGTLFTNAGDTDAITFTLPTLAAGLMFGFLVRADQNVTVASAAGDDIEVWGDAGADSIAFDTPGRKIGSFLCIEANVAGDAWYVRSLQTNGATPTIAT